MKTVRMKVELEVEDDSGQRSSLNLEWNAEQSAQLETNFSMERECAQEHEGPVLTRFVPGKKLVFCLTAMRTER